MLMTLLPGFAIGAAVGIIGGWLVASRTDASEIRTDPRSRN